MGYYDRQGKPITLEQWGKLMATEDYRVVARDHVGAFFVSTVWLGIDHSFSPDGPPVIFETMVFGPRDHPGDQEMWRYCTEEEARSGHAEVVTLVRATVDIET